jgi:putative endonuclease
MDGAGHRGAVGRAAEVRALRYLAGHGLTAVARNFRTRRGEIDLVMLDEDCLVFVEVRTRGSRSFVSASLTVDARKQRKLESAALAFLGRYPVFRHHACRFDVIGIDRTADSRGSVQWVRDAFRPSA